MSFHVDWDVCVCVCVCVCVNTHCKSSKEVLAIAELETGLGRRSARANGQRVEAPVGNTGRWVGGGSVSSPPGFSFPSLHLVWDSVLSLPF